MMKQDFAQPLEWLGASLRMLDQTKLPLEEVYIETADYTVVADAIRTLKVRGAPTIGIAGGYAVALGALAAKAGDADAFIRQVDEVIRIVAGTRPTARNLFHATERMEAVLHGGGTPKELKEKLVAEAVAFHAEEVEAMRRLSEHGASLIEDGMTVLTHCNAGPLATTGYGSALGIILMAHGQGKKVSVFADETRPLLQGARLTTWELQKAGVPVTLITDNMAGHFMKAGRIDCVITGADRITANGDTANKIGTYSVAVLARENGIPFYIAAPFSTIDPSLNTGLEIPIEERSAAEVTHIRDVRIAPDGIEVENPAFDVTPNRYIAAIVTERGIIRPPYGEGISSNNTD